MSDTFGILMQQKYNECKQQIAAERKVLKAEIDFYQQEYEKCRYSKDTILTELRDKDKQIAALTALINDMERMDE